MMFKRFRNELYGRHINITLATHYVPNIAEFRKHSCVGCTNVLKTFSGNVRMHILNTSRSRKVQEKSCQYHLNVFKTAFGSHISINQPKITQCNH